MSDCIICGHYATPDSQYCLSHQDGIPEFRKKATEKTRLKQEARYLKRQIAKGKALLKQRENVAQLRNTLAELKLNTEHMSRF